MGRTSVTHGVYVLDIVFMFILSSLVSGLLLQNFDDVRAGEQPNYNLSQEKLNLNAS